MKKQFADIGLEDLALVGGGCGKKHNSCSPPPCNPDPCGKKKNKMTMETAPDTASLATIPGAPSDDGLSIDINIGGVASSSSSSSAQSLPGADASDVLSNSNALPGADVSIAT